MRTELDRLLVCVDGSDHSREAAEFAASMVEKYEIPEVLMVHVVPTTAVYEGIDVWRVNVMTFLEEHGEKLLDEAVETMKETGVEVEGILTHGDPGSQIVKTARKRDVDLIIMGSRGITGLASVFLGSVGERVARNARCSVLIIRGETFFAEEKEAGAE
ncbi:MAG: universal stress protein [Bacillota bacterium]